jgi:hypothetical protein
MDTPNKVIAVEDLRLSLVLEPVYSQSFGTKESTSKEKQVWEGV